MDGIKPNYASLATNVNQDRFREHDTLEQSVMNMIRPYTDRKHLPDRWISFGGILCPFDVKTTQNCEDKSHDEYAKLSESGYGMFIVYRSEGQLFANWFDELQWSGPFPPTKNSRSGDPWYRIDGGGKPLLEWLKTVKQDIRRKDFVDFINLFISLQGDSR